MANLHHWRVMQHYAMIVQRFAIVIHVRAIALMLLIAQGVQAQSPPQDSLELKLLECDIEQARQKATQSDFWHRLIPRIGKKSNRRRDDASLRQRDHEAGSFAPVGQGAAWSNCDGL